MISETEGRSQSPTVYPRPHFRCCEEPERPQRLRVRLYSSYPSYPSYSSSSKEVRRMTVQSAASARAYSLSQSYTGSDVTRADDEKMLQESIKWIGVVEKEGLHVLEEYEFHIIGSAVASLCLPGLRKILGQGGSLATRRSGRFFRGSPAWPVSAVALQSLSLITVRFLLCFICLLQLLLTCVY